MLQLHKSYLYLNISYKMYNYTIYEIVICEIINNIYYVKM